jgi:thymidylate synthase
LKKIKIQLNRIILKFPTITLPTITSLKDLVKLTSEDFEINNYMHHSSVKVKMVA